MSSADAQHRGYGGYGGGGYGGGGYGGGGYGGGNGNGNSNSNAGPFGANFNPEFFSRSTKILTAHAVLAALAFVVFFPIGGIMIRLLSFPGLWLAHGVFQIFAYLMYIVAFGMGVWLASNFHMLGETHAILGIVVFCLLFFQPILGFAHHVSFKKHGKRGLWSYCHLWIGRLVITLGIINGGLGLKLAKKTGEFGAPTAPSNSQVIAYSVVAAVMWFLYVLAAIVGEARRTRNVQSNRTMNKNVGSSQTSLSSMDVNPPRYK